MRIVTNKVCFLLPKLYIYFTPQMILMLEKIRKKFKKDVKVEEVVTPSLLAGVDYSKIIDGFVDFDSLIGDA